MNYKDLNKILTDLENSELNCVKAFRLFGFNLLNCHQKEAVFLMELLVSAADGRASSMFFSNANCINVYAQDSEYRQALNNATVVFPDGIGVKIAAYLQGINLQNNLSGTELVPYFLRKMTGKGYKAFLLGAKDSVVCKAANMFTTIFPGWQVVGCHHGFFTIREEKAVVSQIKSASPDLLLVGMGSPMQEIWINQHLAELRIPLSIGVGGLFKYWGGGLRRAPSVLRCAGLEWFWLLIHQPSRWLKCANSAEFVAQSIAFAVHQQVKAHKDQCK